MHGPQPVAVPASQQTAKPAPANEAPQIPKKPSNEPTLKKPSTEPIKPTFQQKSPHKNIVKPVEEIALTPAAKPVFKIVSPDIGIMAKRNTSPVDDGFIMKSKANNATVFNGVAMINKPHVTAEDCFPAAEESDGFLGESSPGFDVLVDDELEDSDYFCNKDAEFVRAVDHRRSFINEFDYNRHSPVFLDSLAKYDREPHLDLGGHEFYGRVNDRFGWEQRRASSDRSERLSITERRGLLREQSLNQISGSDLRHRLSKRRRVNNGPSRSDDHHGEFYQRDNDRLHEEQRYKGCSRRDMTHIPRESSISRRLQGRITLPNRSSPDRKFDSSSDRDNERGRNWGVGLSPGRSGPYLRHTDKIKRRVPEEILTMEERNFRGQQSTRRDEVNFAGPKSLSELKNANVYASFRSQVVHEEQKSLSLGKALGGHQEPESSVSFEGPKPLSVILKRKREDGFGSDTDTSNKEERKQVETENLVAESQAVSNVQQSAESRKEADHSHSRNDYAKNNEILDRLVEDGLDSATSIKGDFVPSEEDSMMEEAMEDQEIEDSDQRDREFGEENGDTGDEFLDDEDGDDFARRLGVMFS